jgi:hypothetical protein
MFAADTNAVMPSAIRRRRGCSSSIWLGVTMNRPISNAASKPGTSHLGPAVSRSGSSSWIAIAKSTVSWAGQKGSITAGGG